jgi:hypothetical protein
LSASKSSVSAFSSSCLNKLLSQLEADGQPSSLLDKMAFSMISDMEVLKESRFPPEPKRGAAIIFPPGLELSENLGKFHTFALVITEQDLKGTVQDDKGGQKGG